MKFEWKYNTFFKKNILKKYRLENVTRFHLVWHISPPWVTINGIPLRVKTFIYVLFVIFSFWKAMNDVNSLSPGIRGRDFKHVNFKHNLGIDILSIQVKISLKWMPQVLFDRKQWFRLWLGCVRQHATTWTRVDQDLQCNTAPLGHNKLKYTSLIRSEPCQFCKFFWWNMFTYSYFLEFAFATWEACLSGKQLR